LCSHALKLDFGLRHTWRTCALQRPPSG
jgi:hypothetical protein